MYLVNSCSCRLKYPYYSRKGKNTNERDKLFRNNETNLLSTIVIPLQLWLLRRTMTKIKKGGGLVDVGDQTSPNS
jgi:hypothetical protein